MNLSAIRSVLTAILTTNLNFANAPENVFLSVSEKGMPKDSVVNVSQIVTVDKDFFTKFVAELEFETMFKSLTACDWRCFCNDA